MSDVSVPQLTLRSGVRIPRLGFGTWGLIDPETEVATAIDVGYRLIDTAFAYGNEDAVGRGIRCSGLPRDQLFVTGKLNGQMHGVLDAQRAFGESAAKLGLDYLDLYLIHWPNPQQDRYVDAWHGLEQLLADGKVRSIGLSNFKPSHVQRILREADTVPDLNQIELNPTVIRQELRDFHGQHSIATESWGPLGRGGDMLAAPPIQAVAEAHGRSAAQVVLRWHMHLGLVTVPKSSNRDRLSENLDIFDFELTNDELGAISELDRGEAAAVDSDIVGY